MDGKVMDGKVEGGQGCQVKIRREELERTNFRVLASSIKYKSDTWFIQQEQPMDLLFLRVIFSHLRKQTHPDCQHEGVYESLPFEAFQRAFERMFFVLRDPIGFDARPYDENQDGYVTWGEFFHVYAQRNMTISVSLFERIYLTMDNPDSCKVASWISATMLSVIIISSIAFILGTVPECQIDPTESRCVILKGVEEACLAIFVVEYMARFLTCWAVRSEIFDKAELHEIVVGFEPINLPSPLTRLRKFVFAPTNLIDLAAIAPGVIAFFVNSKGGAFVILRLVRLTRIFRALKSPAFQAPVQVIARTVQQSTKALYVLMFNLCLGIVIFGSLMYMAEGGEELNAFGVGGRWNPEIMKFERIVDRNWNATSERWDKQWDTSPFQSIPHAFWWAIVTVATVGYGDHYPTTSLGYTIAVGAMVFSLVILALPIGIVGNNFTQEWDNYEKKKAKDAADVEAEMRFITSAIKCLDPTRMSKLMLLEVWHDNPNLPNDLPARGPPSSFMGEAKLDLDLDINKSITFTRTLDLEDNLEVVKRHVSGTLTVHVEWRPDSEGWSDDEDSELEILDQGRTKSPGTVRTSTSRTRSLHEGPQAHSTETRRLRGQLKVTILQAERLVNLSCGKPDEGSSPYCLVLCYPTFKKDDRAPVPYAWRSPVCRNTMAPKWNATHTFDFRWSRHTVNSKTALFDGKAPLEETLQDGRSSPQNLPEPPSTTPQGLDVHAGARNAKGEEQMDQAIHLLKEFTKELVSRKSEIKQVQDDIKALSGRIDRISEGETLHPNFIPEG